MPHHPAPPAPVVPPPELESFSDVVGAIYDCALDPIHWQRALTGICGLFGAAIGSISLQDRAGENVQFSAIVGDAYWIDLLVNRYAPTMPAFHVLNRFKVDEPFSWEVLGPVLGPDWRDVLHTTPLWREWNLPGEMRDFVSANIFKDAGRNGSLVMTLPDVHGPVTEADYKMMRLLAPHVRRAVAICDLLGMASLKVSRLEAALDALAPGVVLVDAETRILYANQSAEAMLSDGTLRADQGYLSAPEKRGRAELAAAVRQAARDEAGLGGAGIGVALSDATRRPLLAHVLPLRQRQGVAGLPDRAEAAAFFTVGTTNGVWPEALAAHFGLTPAEARVAGAIAAGLTRVEAAERLGIARSTVKTHLERIFAKTRTSSQRDLARLAATLAPPARR